MKKTDISFTKIPDAPGVYFFLGPRKKILYIGKATSLKNRVRSYFDSGIADKRSPWIARMVSEATTVDIRETESVLDALILEANLIKYWKPPYNTDGKDDKTWNYVVITNEEYPRVLLVRGHDLYQQFEEKELKRVFGPFPHGGQLKEALKIVRKIFPFFDTRKPVGAKRSRHEEGSVIFNQQIGVYPNPRSVDEYTKTIRHIILLFEGKKPTLLKELEKEMKVAVKAERFEDAEILKRQMFALTHIRDIALIKEDLHVPDGGARIEAYDVAHLGGSAMVGVMVVLEGGTPKKSDYRKFKIKSTETANDTKALAEVLRRRFAHDEWPLPTLIVVDGSTAQLNSARAVLDEFGYSIPLVGVVKDEHHRPRSILGEKRHSRDRETPILLANAEAHRFAMAYHTSLRGVFPRRKKSV